MPPISRRIAQLTLLSRLGQALNAATGLAGLCASASGVLLEHSEADCVILRPQLAIPSPVKDYYLRASSADPARQAFLLQQEQQLSQQVLRSGRSRLQCPLSGRDSSLPAALYSIPLKAREQLLGTLSLFGGAGEAAPFSQEQQQLFLTCGFQIAQAIEQLLTMAQLRQVSASDSRKLHDLSLLYRIGQMLHSTMATNELIHLILSLLVLADGGGFQRAMLFMVNERSDSLQGMLGVTRESAGWLLPAGLPPESVQQLPIPPEVQQVQREAPFSREVMQQRLPIASSQSCLARVVREQQAQLINRPPGQRPVAEELCGRMQLGDHACVPLIARGRTICVLVVDNHGSTELIDQERLRFLELFAGQAGIALDNAQLVHHTETAHRNLRETQERLLQREKLATIGEMSASVAHELRNPMVALGGFARRLTKLTPGGSEEHQYAEIIASETRRLEKMLDNILSFSKQHLLCINRYRLEGVFEQALLLEQKPLEQAGIELCLELDPELPQMQGDAEQLGQVLVNLISNARQAMTDGGLLRLSAYPAHLRGEPAVRIEVNDTGGGIPAKLMRNIFNPFFTTKQEGTGLGLPICHRIVEHHQGELEVINHETGATFSITLPVRLHQRSADPLQGRQEN